MIMLAPPPINYPKFIPPSRDVFTTHNTLKWPLNAPDPTMAYMRQVDP